MSQLDHRSRGPHPNLVLQRIRPAVLRQPSSQVRPRMRRSRTLGRQMRSDTSILTMRWYNASPSRPRMRMRETNIAQQPLFKKMTRPRTTYRRGKPLPVHRPATAVPRVTASVMKIRLSHHFLRPPSSLVGIPRNPLQD